MAFIFATPTVIKPFASSDLLARESHLKVGLVPLERIDALLGKPHEEHVQRNARDCIPFALNLSILPPLRLLIWFALHLGKFLWIW